MFLDHDLIKAPVTDSSNSDTTWNDLVWCDRHYGWSHSSAECRIWSCSAFNFYVCPQRQRGNIQREFTQWLQQCHEKLDKQIKFEGYKETLTRTDVPTKKKQYPWAAFSTIEWDGRIYQAGQLVSICFCLFPKYRWACYDSVLTPTNAFVQVKSHKTQPILYGTVIQFLLHGHYKEDVFATGGEVEIALVSRQLRFSPSSSLCCPIKFTCITWHCFPGTQRAPWHDQDHSHFQDWPDGYW